MANMQHKLAVDRPSANAFFCCSACHRQWRIIAGQVCWMRCAIFMLYAFWSHWILFQICMLWGNIGDRWVLKCFASAEGKEWYVMINDKLKERGIDMFIDAIRLYNHSLTPFLLSPSWNPGAQKTLFWLGNRWSGYAAEPVCSRGTTWTLKMVNWWMTTTFGLRLLTALSLHPLLLFVSGCHFLLFGSTLGQEQQCETS